MRNRNQRRRTRKATPAKKTTRLLQARDLLKPDHPLHKPFVAWVAARASAHAKGHVVSGSGYGGTVADPTTPTVRKARKFLSAHPAFKGVVVEQEAA